MPPPAGGTGWVRDPAVAGLFYPSDPERLRADVTEHVRAAAQPDDPTPPKAVIAPHAGYRYSGPTAGAAYKALAPRRGRVARVVLAGPAHRVPIEGVAVSTAEAWRTPLGDLPLDAETTRDLVERGDAVESDEAHRPEHSLEVHLPFIHEVLGRVAILPLVIGRAAPELVARVLERTWGGEETAVVISSDLSHYLDDHAARARDHRTEVAILEGRSDDVGPYDACGCVPISGLLVAARDLGVVARTLATATSADTSGDTSRVVGYGSFGFGVPQPLDDADRAWLSAYARAALRSEPDPDLGDPVGVGDVPARARAPGASFVTLEVDGQLAGCIGSLEPVRPLWRDVAHNARAAAFEDPRFAPIDRGAIDRAVMKISVLSALEPMPGLRPVVLSSVRPGVDGLVLAAEGRRGTFLPAVWDKLTEPNDFLDQLVVKTGLEAGQWPDAARVWRYTTDEWADAPP
jgi:AmmeMemoRadiSam system protein B/AmmeMemoRadiSam system protein A